MIFLEIRVSLPAAITLTAKIMATQVLHLPDLSSMIVQSQLSGATFSQDGASWSVEINLDYPQLNSDKVLFLQYEVAVPEALSRLWKILYWYFQLPAPSPALIYEKKGSPHGPWKVYFKTASGFFADPEFLEAAIASGMVSFSSSSPNASLECYATRSSFWQVPPEPLLGWADRKPFIFPKPAEYTITNGIRHPVRPRPGTVGDIYRRWIPSLGQFLTFRLASMENDAELMHRWMNDPRVAEFWGEDGGDIEKTRGFLKKGLESQHCYPVIGSWDGEPFGYFEVYWVKEDALGKFVTDCDNWDRGVHCLVGEQKFRGPHRVGVWISSLVHCKFIWMVLGDTLLIAADMFLSDPRTQAVMLEPRVDNEK